MSDVVKAALQSLDGSVEAHNAAFKRWERVQGAVEHHPADGDIPATTHFVLAASANGKTFRQRVVIVTSRLRTQPGAYKRILDDMVRDISARIK